MKQIIMCAAMAFSAAGGVSAQAPAPAFEVASVKPAPPPTGPGLFVRLGGDPGRIDYKNVTLKLLMARAYEVKEFQISGPEWLDTERYDVMAKIPDGAKREDTPKMLQALLAERFRLKFHREEKVTQTYALVVGKGGAKLKPAEGDGRLSMSIGPRGRQVKGSGNIASLTTMLSNMLDRPVLDKTELNGTYDLSLEWTPDDREGGGMMRRMVGMMRPGGGAPGAPLPDAHAQPPADAPENPNAPNLFTAVQEKFGLRLEPAKAPVAMLIVDTAEKVPTEN